jgi:hypothetical protein
MTGPDELADVPRAGARPVRRGRRHGPGRGHSELRGALCRGGRGSGGGLDVLLSARRVGPAGKAYGLDMTDESLAPMPVRRGP